MCFGPIENCVFETVVYWRMFRLQLELLNDDHWPLVDVSIDGDDVTFTLKSFQFILEPIELHTSPEHVGPFYLEHQLIDSK